MGIDYVLIAGILLYFAVIKIMAKLQLKPIHAATIVVLGYFALTTVTKAIFLSVYGISFWQILLDVSRIFTTILQFGVAFFVFRQMQERGSESYGSWFAWGVAGFIVIFFATPFIATKLTGI